MANTKKVMVTKDVSVEEMLQWDKDGHVLVWDVDDFRKLSPAQLKAFSKPNRDRYEVFKEIAETEANRDVTEEEVADAVQVGVAAGTATERLHVESQKDGYRYRWERPDMVNVRKDQGWRVATKGYKTLRNERGRDIHRIGSKGQEELILMEISDENHAKLREAKAARRKRAIEGVINQGKSEIRKLGSQPIDDTSGGDFTPISQQEVDDG